MFIENDTKPNQSKNQSSLRSQRRKENEQKGINRNDMRKGWSL